MSDSLRVDESWVRSLVRDMGVISEKEVLPPQQVESDARLSPFAKVFLEEAEGQEPQEKVSVGISKIVGDGKPQLFASTAISDQRMIELFHNLWDGSDPCPVNTDNHKFLPIFNRLIKVSADDLDGEAIDWTALAKEINSAIYSQTEIMYSDSSITIDDILSMPNKTRRTILLVKRALASTEDKAATFNKLIKGYNKYSRVIDEEFKKKRGLTDIDLQVGGMIWWKNPKFDKRKKMR